VHRVDDLSSCRTGCRLDIGRLTGVGVAAIRSRGRRTIREADEAIPLERFIAETMAVLGTDADEIAVEGAKAFRSNVGPNEQGLVSSFNAFAMANFVPSILDALDLGRVHEVAPDIRTSALLLSASHTPIVSNAWLSVVAPPTWQLRQEGRRISYWRRPRQRSRAPSAPNLPSALLSELCGLYRILVCCRTARPDRQADAS
jgi:hypothetical protein